MAESIFEKVDIVNLPGTPGLEFTKVFDKNKSSGVISGIVKRTRLDPGVSDRDSLDGDNYQKLFPAQWNGVPRYSITAKAMYNGDIYLWCNYKFTNRNGKWPSMPARFQISHGQQSLRVYTSYTSDTKPLDVEGGREVMSSLVTIKWNLDSEMIKTGQEPPSGVTHGLTLLGTINSNSIYFGGLNFPPHSLRYIGPETEYKDDQWKYHHVALGRTYYASVGGSVRYWEEPVPEELKIGTGGYFRKIYKTAVWK